MVLVKSTVEEFCQILGSSAPAPGGGSVAALSGALGAELVSMVCHLSIGKAGLEEFQELLKESLEKSQGLAKELLERVDLDTLAFNDVMAAFKMPKETEQEKSTRRDAIQSGYKVAVQSPLGIAEGCVAVLQVAEKLIGKFNTNAMSDFGVSALQAHAGLEGAIMNVRINLPSIKDEKFVAQTNKAVAALLEKGSTHKEKIYTYVQNNIG